LFSRPDEPDLIQRPFAATAQVRCRGYSLGLERVVVDLAADGSFAQAVEKVAEHYGIEVSQSTVRVITERHGAAMSEASGSVARMPGTGVSLMVGEMDGSHVPCVEFGVGTGDKRKRRGCYWHEAKLCLARVVGSTRTRYAATMEGLTEAGRRWRTAAIDAGAGRTTRLHCVGDGAPCVAAQVKAQFGRQATYLVDFFHVSEYLAAAGESIAGTHAKEWLSEKQAWLKENRAAEVIGELSEWREAEGVAEVNAPVRKAFRYLSERREYLDYQGALREDLPIGSGEIEGGHRSVVQARLKKSGAWWLRENAEKMLSLRVYRANGEWESYWQQLRQAHA